MSWVTDLFDRLLTTRLKLTLEAEPRSTPTGPTTPTGPIQPTTPPATTGPDLSVNGLQAFAWANSLDGVGPYDYADVLPLGLTFAYMSEITGFPRTGWSEKWQGYLTPPVDGDYTFVGDVKSGGYIKVGGVVLAEQDRESDPGNHDQWKPSVTAKGLKAGVPVPFEVFFTNQANEHVCQWSWVVPGPTGSPTVTSIPRTALNPPLGWVKKSYTPPPAPVVPVTPAGPAPVLPTQPDWNTYKSPDLTGVALPNPADWTVPINSAAVDPASPAIVARQGAAHVHPEFGFGMNGIPYQEIPAGTPKVMVTFDIPKESDFPTTAAWPIPDNPVLENGGNPAGDYHWIGLSREDGKVYEIYQLRKEGGVWKGFSGAVWSLGTQTTRPLGWTSADGAGLPMLPGIVRYDEVAAGKIGHAIRMTVGQTRKGYIPPASHSASNNTDPTLPPMGTRWRLKATTDLSAFPPQSKVVAQALKDYGTVTADNGSNGFLFITGTPDSRWSDDDLAHLKNLHASDFEVILMGPVQGA